VAKPKALEALPDLEPSPRTELPPNPLESPHDVQAAVEGVPVNDRVTFLGEEYRVAEKVGLMPLMRFAHAARKGTNTDDMEGLAAIYDMLHDCIHPDDWDRFCTDATDKKAEGDDLIPVVSQTIEILTARPTRRPSDSSAGPSTTSVSSTGSSSSQPIPDGLMSVDELLRRAEAG
jgi:hypothetical protein